MYSIPPSNTVASSPGPIRVNIIKNTQVRPGRGKGRGVGEASNMAQVNVQMYVVIYCKYYTFRVSAFTCRFVSKLGIREYSTKAS